MKSCADAAFAAADSMSAIGTSAACLTPARPTAMFIADAEASKSSGSCETTPTARSEVVDPRDVW